MYVANRSSNARQLNAGAETRRAKKPQSAAQKRKRKSRARMKLVCYLLALFSILFVVCLRYVYIYDLHNSIATKTSELEKLRMENEQTRLSLESMTDISKIENYAVTELGLQKAENRQIVYLQPAKEDTMKNVAAGQGAGRNNFGIFSGFLEYLH